MDSFVTSLYELAEYCSFGELHDEMIRDRLVVGLRDQRVSEKLQLDAELTLEKALTQARQHEAVKAQQPVVRGQKVESSSLDAVQGKKGQTKPKNSMNRDSAVVKNTSQQKCKRCGGNIHPRDKCPAKDSKCHKCKGKGHWARACLSKPAVNEVYENSDDDDGFLGSVEGHESTVQRTASIQCMRSHGSPTSKLTASTSGLR